MVQGYRNISRALDGKRIHKQAMNKFCRLWEMFMRKLKCEKVFGVLQPTSFLNSSKLPRVHSRLVWEKRIFFSLQYSEISLRGLFEAISVLEKWKCFINNLKIIKWKMTERMFNKSFDSQQKGFVEWFIRKLNFRERVYRKQNERFVWLRRPTGVTRTFNGT